jgi:2-iminobutanoate/2-iminopropanoate deaminase
MRTAITTADAPAAIGPYSQAVRHGGYVWCSGQLGLDPARGVLVSDDVAAQARQALTNLAAVCREGGTSLGTAVRLTVYLVDMADFPAVNAVYQEFFSEPYPARATVAVAALPKNGRVEIDAVVPV